MNQSRMSGIGKLHDDGHVPCKSYKRGKWKIQNKVLLEQNYNDSVLFNLREGLLRTSCSHQPGIEE